MSVRQCDRKYGLMMISTAFKSIIYRDYGGLFHVLPAFFLRFELTRILVSCLFEYVGHIFLYNELCQHCRHNLNEVKPESNCNYMRDMRYLGWVVVFSIIYIINRDPPARFEKFYFGQN